jgi:hypothetical protein
MTLSELILILTEQMANLLYTARTLDNALTALREDRLRAGRSPSAREKRPPFVAFSRSRTFWYAPLYRPVRFVINGSRLAQRYKILPFALDDFDKRGRNFQFEVYVSRDIVPLSRYLVAIELSTKSLFTQEDIRDTVAQIRQYTQVPLYLHGKPRSQDIEDLDVDALMGFEDEPDVPLTAGYHRFLSQAGRHATGYAG